MVRVPVRRCQREPFGILHHQQITSTFTFYLLKKGKQRLWRALSLRREEEGGGRPELPQLCDVILGGSARTCARGNERHQAEDAALRGVRARVTGETEVRFKPSFGARRSPLC